MTATTAAPAAAVVVVEEERRRRAAWRPLAAAAIAGSVLVTTGFGVWASLSASATNTTPQTVETGTLKLALADNGAGFTATVSNVAPGDSVHRYVTLTNNGTLEGKDLTMAVTATGSPVLVTDAAGSATSKALRLSVSTCAVAWNPTTGACAGTAADVVAPTVLSSLSTAVSLGSTPSILAGGTAHLRITATLPDQNETSVNGVLPTGTVQGAKASLSYVFTEVQRAGTTTGALSLRPLIPGRAGRDCGPPFRPSGVLDRVLRSAGPPAEAGPRGWSRPRGGAP